MSETLEVKVRDSRGKRNARRMRQRGMVPAVLYGHKEKVVSLSVCADALGAALRHGSKVVELRGELNESALIREIQWNTFGTDVLHVDFSRVSVGESVETTISVVLRGEAPGTKEGGVVSHQLHEVTIICPVISIPERLEVNINGLQLGQSLTAASLRLPEGAQLVTDADAVLVTCALPAAPVEEEGVPGAEAAEPELIGRKPAEEEGEE